jgi:hypothetical protein
MVTAPDVALRAVLAKLLDCRFEAQEAVYLLGSPGDRESAVAGLSLGS